MHVFFLYSEMGIILDKVFRYIFRFIVTMFFLSVFVFIFSRLIQGDPLQSFYAEALDNMTADEIARARKRFGLDGSYIFQYISWAKNFLRGEFGISLKYRKPAILVVKGLIGNTLILGITAYILVFLLSIIIAMVCCIHENGKLDHIICRLGTVAFYIPPFWMGVVLILIFSVNLKVLPSSGAYDIGKAGNIGNRIYHMILPLIVMVLSHVWYYTYMIRNKFLDEVREDYVLVARMKGLTNREILIKHCFRNVLPTIINIMAISVPHVLSGTYIAEAVFNYPGIGYLAIESTKYHDYNLLMLLVMITGTLVVLSGILADIINEIINPKIKRNQVSIWK